MSKELDNESATMTLDKCTSYLNHIGLFTLYDINTQFLTVIYYSDNTVYPINMIKAKIIFPSSEEFSQSEVYGCLTKMQIIKAFKQSFN